MERSPRTSNGLTLHLLGTLSEAIGADAEKIEETEVTKNLELLADFGLDIVVVGVKFLEGAFEGVDFGELELRFSQGADSV